MVLGLSNPRRARDGSWLVDPDRVRLLGEKVRALLAVGRALRTFDAREPPFSIDVLANQVDRAVGYGRWYVATSACALLGELLFASAEMANGKKATGIYKITNKPKRLPLPQRTRHELHRGLAALRNACFHPALVIGKGEGSPAVERFARTLELLGHHPLAKKVDRDWSCIHDPAVTAWAVDAVDKAGRFELGELGPTVDRR